jgi:hypothetical protein
MHKNNINRVFELLEYPLIANCTVGARPESKRSYGCAPLRNPTLNPIIDCGVMYV